jgi:hypothetical protein
MGQGSAPAGIKPAWQPKAEAVALLGEVLSRMTTSELPIVQFIPATAGHTCGDVARDFAIAAVARLGRTLLVAADPGCSAEPGAPHPVAWRVPERGRFKPSGLVPDPMISGLYHMRLQGGAAEAAKLAIESQAGWNAAAADFRMVVIESLSPSRSPETLLMSPACRGAVLTVLAGVTRLAEVEAAARQIGNAGGILLGCVLHEARASAFTLPWRRRVK